MSLNNILYPFLGVSKLDISKNDKLKTAILGSMVKGNPMMQLLLSREIGKSKEQQIKAEKALRECQTNDNKPGISTTSKAMAFMPNQSTTAATPVANSFQLSSGKQMPNNAMVTEVTRLAEYHRNLKYLKGEGVLQDKAALSTKELLELYESEPNNPVVELMLFRSLNQKINDIKISPSGGVNGGGATGGGKSVRKSPAVKKNATVKK